jgi:hypothetical protein
MNPTPWMMGMFVEHARVKQLLKPLINRTTFARTHNTIP